MLCKCNHIVYAYIYILPFFFFKQTASGIRAKLIDNIPKLTQCHIFLCHISLAYWSDFFFFNYQITPYVVNSFIYKSSFQLTELDWIPWKLTLRWRLVYRWASGVWTQ